MASLAGGAHMHSILPSSANFPMYQLGASSWPVRGLIFSRLSVLRHWSMPYDSPPMDEVVCMSDSQRVSGI